MKAGLMEGQPNNDFKSLSMKQIQKTMIKKKNKWEPGMVAHTCNPSAQEAEAIRSVVQGQPVLNREHSEIHESAAQKN